MKTGSRTFNRAMELISESNDITIKLNSPDKNGSYTNAVAITILDSNASIISALIKDGFSLFMTDGKLQVEDFSHELYGK